MRTVSSYFFLSALLNWFKLVYRLFEQSNMHHTFDFCPDQTSQEGIKYIKLKSSCLIYILWIKSIKGPLHTMDGIAQIGYYFW